MEELSSTWVPPNFNLEGEPTLQDTYELQADDDFPDNFARYGKCLGQELGWICISLDLRKSKLSDSNNSKDVSVSRTSKLPNTPSSEVFSQPNAILDCVWYPTATCFDSSTYCFMASIRECPVKLLDAGSGRLRASYSIVDHRERQIAPHSMAFGTGGQRLYCGFEDAIEIFDVNRPGEGSRLPTTPSKKSRDGLKGIISALAFAPSQGSDFFAAGTFSQKAGNIALFDDSQGEGPLMYVAGSPAASVMQIQFNPAKPYLVYAAFRRQTAVYCWDLRSSTEIPVNTYDTGTVTNTTNQRLRFDIDSNGRHLAIGDQTGTLSLFDLGEECNTAAPAEGMTTSSGSSKPKLSFSAHQDSIGSSAFHPTQSVLLTTSGSRHFQEHFESESSDDDTSGEEEPTFLRRRQRSQPVPRDRSIKLWSFHQSDHIPFGSPHSNLPVAHPK